MAKGSLLLKIFDGTRALLSNADVLVSLWDGNQRRVHWNYHKGSQIQFTIPLADNFVDNYRVVVSANGYRDAGQSAVRVGTTPVEVSLMLVPKKPKFTFDALSGLSQKVRKLLEDYMASQPKYAAADQAAYELLQADNSAGLAALLNISSAFEGFDPHPMDFVERLLTLAPDRFFATAQEKFVDFMEQEKKEGTFHDAPSSLHPGADFSYKERRYPEANVQFTFTRNKPPNGFVTVDADIDYYADEGSHFLLEIFPSDVVPAIIGTSKKLTDPTVAYALRWMAMQRRLAASGLAFDPPYILEQAKLG
jgi:hypothetical protein